MRMYYKEAWNVNVQEYVQCMNTIYISVYRLWKDLIMILIATFKMLYKKF